MAGAYREAIMSDSVQRRDWISGIRLRAAGAALTLVVVLVVGVVAGQSSQAQTFTVLYNFTGAPDGASPFAGVTRDAAGNLYGTTYTGASSGYGVVFKVGKSGTESVLYSFNGGTDGGSPVGGLVRDTAGNLYGTAEYGGSSGNGVVFKVDKSGAETVLHSFSGGTADGCSPDGGLVRDKAGNLYGTTMGCGVSGNGIVFKVTKRGAEKLLHSFAGGKADGANPLYTSLLMDMKGNLYGVTSQGGSQNSGVVYKLSQSGKLTVLHSFAGGTTDGCSAHGTPAMDKAGNLYGTTSRCGSGNHGIVWKVSKKGAETVLFNFTGGSSDGANPIAGVVLDAQGNFYGNTQAGGASDDGTVFELSTKGVLTLLHTFDGSDGATPYGSIIRDAKGNVYGTTLEGGNVMGSYGTVWKLTP
jgi:uncharacterized repeat protein (TIGR03803 family)